jgi:glycosyltransferase A (GT-A) superfamily protein (DUF2064 family)
MRPLIRSVMPRSVIAATRQLAAEAGLRLAELAPLWDIDRGDDLDRALALGLVRLPNAP